LHGYKSWPEDDRRKTQDPEAIFSKAGLKPGMTVIDIGCGQGYFSIPVAKIVGKDGNVYCIDIDEESIETLKDRASREGLDNVQTFIGNAETTVPCEVCADIVFFGICLHDFEDPSQVLNNAMRMLKPSGVLADLDWKKLHMEGGPPYKIRFSEAKASRLMADAGFRVRSVEDIGDRYYLVLANSR
jgi:ubiquinone/menaquinone biosynthesis C-methylase UbiE